MQHVYPPNDEQSHVLNDMVRCPCRPRLVQDAYGNVTCFHTPFDMRHLVSQAEEIRKFESVKMWEEWNKRIAEDPSLKAKANYIYFESGEPAKMPPIATRIPPEDHQGAYPSI